ncbi:MAG: phosphoglycolate phosphatase [Rubrivivax sp.]|nr:phosphoglycolate phosphatase [Rubrivivax sp.]
MQAPVRLVLFDLDGTLIDSAPDLAGAANELRASHGLGPLPYAELRPMVGSGARGMVRQAFDIGPGEARYEALRVSFLDAYEARMLRLTRIFDEMQPVLLALEARGMRWGVVTNKAQRFAAPITQALGIAQRAAVVIAGDSTPYTKPHPEPLHEAARRAGCASADAVYVGDDPRDIQAGRAAGMRTAAAAWGYLGLGEPVEAWGADIVLPQPARLLNWLQLA